jgi:hypothetical protein
MAVEAHSLNVRIYEHLFLIETILRELLIEQLAGLDGPKWYKGRLPSEALQHFHMGIASDRATRWTRNIPHHPVYYLGFPDLRLTIEQKDNWNDAFKAIFPKMKELVTTDLFELEFIRNKVAHSRRASSEDLRIVQAAYSKLSSTLTPKRAAVLASRYSVATDIPGLVKAMAREADMAYALTAAGRRARYLPQWQKAQETYWWFDEAYLGSSIKSIEDLFIALASAAGPGHDTMQKDQLKAKYQAAKSEFAGVIKNWAHLAD